MAGTLRHPTCRHRIRMTGIAQRSRVKATMWHFPVQGTVLDAWWDLATDGTTAFPSCARPGAVGRLLRLEKLNTGRCMRKHYHLLGSVTSPMQTYHLSGIHDRSVRLYRSKQTERGLSRGEAYTPSYDVDVGPDGIEHIQPLPQRR
jgi:hypothetical protein